jgi:hypothetical protein
MLQFLLLEILIYCVYNIRTGIVRKCTSATHFFLNYITTGIFKHSSCFVPPADPYKMLLTFPTKKIKTFRKYFLRKRFAFLKIYLQSTGWWIDNFF